MAKPQPQELPVQPGAQELPQGFFGWLWSWLTTVDHKRIAKLYFLFSALFVAIAGAEALAMRMQLMTPQNTLIDASTFNQLFTMHGTSMIFLVGMPLIFGFINAVMPLQIGARDMAFPFMNALSLWLFVVGGLMLNSSWFLGGAPDAGWFAYAPVSTTPYNPGPGMDFYAIGLQIAGLGTFMSGINFLATIIGCRAPGMSFWRMPMFCWTTFVTSALVLFAMPPLTIDLFELIFDRLFGTNFFNVAGGGNVVVWDQLFWIFGHPEVYILILPAFGIFSEVVPTMSKKPLFGYSSMVFATLLIGFLSYMVWTHHMFDFGFGPVINTIFTISSMLIAVPTGIKIFNWIFTMWNGHIRWNTAMYFAVGFIPSFVMGGVTGVMLAMAPADLQYHDSYFVVAHFHYVLIGGLIFGLFAGIFYWFPKIYGRMLDERLGKITFWLILIGFHTTFLPQHFMGLLGMPRRVFTYKAGMGLETLNLISTIGSWIMGVGFLIFLINLVHTLRSGPRASADPWDGRTLEWATSSPAPEYNFAAVPLIRARDALWAEKQHGNGRIPAAQPPGPIHMPSPSILPFVMAVGLMIAGYGGVYRSIIAAAVGLVITAVGVIYSIVHQDRGFHVHPAAPEAQEEGAPA